MFNRVVDMKFSGAMCSPLVPFFLTVLSAKFLQANCDLRCYCNLPVCVATGYMCKSDLGTCFTEHTGRHPSRHGCLELARPQATTAICGTNKEPLYCCREDMCNYVSALDVNLHIQTHKRNHTHREHSKVAVASDGSNVYGHDFQDALQQQDLWFKAAVIAVPIAGTFILVLLILLAAHMLKQDSRCQQHRQRQYNTRLLLGEAYVHKAPFGVPQEYPIVALSADCFSELYTTKDFVYDKGRFANNWDPIKSSTLV